MLLEFAFDNIYQRNSFFDISGSFLQVGQRQRLTPYVTTDEGNNRAELVLYLLFSQWSNMPHQNQRSFPFQ